MKDHDDDDDDEKEAWIQNARAIDRSSTRFEPEERNNEAGASAQEAERRSSK